MKNRNTLTLIKIIVCCVLFFCVPVCIDSLNHITESRTIAMTLVISTISLLMIGANHQLAALHWRRFAGNLKESAVYILLSALFVLAVVYLSGRFFAFQIEAIDPAILSSYPFFAPVILLNYTFSYAFCFNITFKLLTDKIHFHAEPHLIILFSGLLFGLFLTASQFVVLNALHHQFDLTLILKGFSVNALISLCCSYCYNQTRSVVPMIFGMTLASFVLLFL